jgi:S-adenosylmethionine:tRNA ribosyltransferase-isomerase
MNPREISINDFIYELPPERIALHPLAERDSSRLLIRRNKTLTEDIYRNIGRHLPPGTLLIFNNTKVIEARLIFQKNTGGLIEIFILEASTEEFDISRALQQTGSAVCKCLVGGASKWKKDHVQEKTVASVQGTVTLRAEIVEKVNDHFRIRFSWTPETLTLADMLHLAGQIPLPPYIRRQSGPADSVRYQTVYGSQDGSVAAPTAGLHFTDNIFSDLSEKGIRKCFVTLHVGAGTFKPVKSEKMEGHEMHGEYLEVSRETLRVLHQHEGPVYAVGTTSLRTMESIYWMGLKAFHGKGMRPEDLVVSQWEPYDMPRDLQVDAKKAVGSLLEWMEKSGTDRLISRTNLMIAPGYRFRMIRGLVTNFHQPRSTLLLLVAAMIGKDWKGMYEHALEKGFRFLSYGDGCLIECEKIPD